MSEAIMFQKFMDPYEKLIIPDNWFNENTIKIIDRHYPVGTYNILSFDPNFYSDTTRFSLPWVTEYIRNLFL